RVVCTACNNRWMSGLQLACKPILLSFIAGKWMELEQAQQQQIAAWITMFTMVWELRDPRTMAIPTEQREYFRQTRLPPSEWKIWIGRTADIWEGHLNHIAWTLVKAESEDALKTLVKPSVDSQITAFCLGNLFLMVFSSTSEAAHDDEKEF